MSFKSGHKVVPLTPRLQELCSHFAGRKGTIQLQPDGWTYYEAFINFAEKYRQFELYEDDIILLTMPKSGTTWGQETIWTLRHNINFDNPDAKIPLAARSPVLEGDFLIFNNSKKPEALVNMISQRFPNYDQSQGLFLKAAEAALRPRLLKTHVGMPLLPSNLLDKAKVIYVIRDPRDVCLSFQHHSRIFQDDGFVGTQSQFVDAFIESAINWGPYWTHVKYAWEKRDHPNMHIVFYDEMKRDPMPVYRKLADFLGVKATDEQLKKVIDYTSFSSMKARDDHIIPAPDVKFVLNMDKVKKEGGFFRKGVSGGWKNTLTQQEKDKFEVWIKGNCPDPEIMKRITGE